MTGKNPDRVRRSALRPALSFKTTQYQWVDLAIARDGGRRELKLRQINTASRARFYFAVA
jgi:hypothetical protein